MVGGDRLRGGGEGDRDSLVYFLLRLGGGDLESEGLLLGLLLFLPPSESESESLSELELNSELETSLDESLSELDSAAFNAAC